MNVQADFVLFKAVMYLGSYVKIFFLAICALLATEEVETYQMIYNLSLNPLKHYK